MKKIKRIHPGYKEFQKFKKQLEAKQLFGKWQFIYSSNRGKISLVKLKDYFSNGKDIWKIYCLEGDLFYDVERFDTQKDAEERVKLLLGKD